VEDILQEMARLQEMDTLMAWLVQTFCARAPQAPTEQIRDGVAGLRPNEGNQ
jgi:hypothetical protein